MYQEEHRPQYHFSPPKNWMNDPNGLVYFEGEYHLFYQHNPYDTVTGHLAWGHAVSEDLVHWKHLPIALEEHHNEDGTTTMIFSGSAVVNDDKLVAIYSGHVHRDGEDLREFQSLAISTDKGRSFVKYEGNPVLDIGKKNFRDPKVFWYEPLQYWIMAVSLPYEYKVQFYKSKDLISWDLLSTFGDAGDQSIIWECPDIFPLQVENSLTQKWVLLVTSAGPHKGFMGMQYFIGDFDGVSFTATQAHRYVDYGKDYFAGVTWNNAPDNKRLLIGWMNNWAYGQQIPTEGWRSAQSVVRELALVQQGKDFVLKQSPITALQQLRCASIVWEGELTDSNSYTLPLPSRCFELIVTSEINNCESIEISLFRALGETPHTTTLIYDVKGQELRLDRRHSGIVDFHKDFASVETAPLSIEGTELKLHIFVDASLIEIFAQDGLLVLSEQVFPTKTGSLEIKTKGGTAKTTSHFWEMKSIWSENQQ